LVDALVGGERVEEAGERSIADLSRALSLAAEAVDGLGRSAAEGRGWREVVEAVGEPVVATDERGRVVLMNRAAERALGVRFDDRPRVIDDLIAQHDVLALYQAASEGRPASARVRLVADDESRVYDTTASPLAPGRAAGVGAGGMPAASDGARGAADPGRNGREATPRRWGVVLAFRDVTDLATAIQARTDFVANASHELRTPLAALRAAYDTLRMAIDDPRMRDRALQLAGNNLQRLEEMTRDLLDLSRMESPETQVRISRVDVRELVEDTAAPFDVVRQARRLSFSIEVAAEARQADTDPRLVQEILRNLIDNACRFAHEGTTIRIVGEALADAAHGPERATLRLRVIDQGIGIPLDQQARIFERFYQVDPARSGKRRGTGLGLAIVKHAVRALGGSVDVESVWGQGTTMIVELPSAVAVAVAE
jgi:two-component system phosphate regulon sensor histidine kinase PhoR